MHLLSVWPDLAIFRHFGKSLHFFGKFLTVCFLFGKTLSLLSQICDIFGLILIVANGKIIQPTSHTVCNITLIPASFSSHDPARYLDLGYVYT